MTCDALPAVVDPSFLKAGLSLESDSKVVSFLIPSSFVIVTSRSFSSLSLTTVLTGTISESKRPAVYARCARRCDSTANLS